MSPDRLHKCLAIAVAILVTGIFVAANVHLVTVAYHSQPSCVTPVAGHVPASTDC